MTITWGDFKKLAEEAGITDDMEIYYIDTGNYPDYSNLRFSPDDPNQEDRGIVISG